MSDDPIAVKRAKKRAKEWAKEWAKAAEEEAWEAWVEAKAQAESNDGGLTEADLRAKAEAWVKAKAAAKAAEESSDGDPTEAELQTEMEAAWGWLEAATGRRWASADEATNDAGMTFEALAGEAISTGLGRSAEDWETMPAVEPDAGPSQADLRGEVQHGD